MPLTLFFPQATWFSLFIFVERRDFEERMSRYSRTGCTFSLSLGGRKAAPASSFGSSPFGLNLQPQARQQPHLEASPILSGCTGPCIKFPQLPVISLSMCSPHLLPSATKCWSPSPLRTGTLSYSSCSQSLATVHILSTLVWPLTHSASPGTAGAPVSGRCPPPSPWGCGL